jgi:hypothetical protein
MVFDNIVFYLRPISKAAHLLVEEESEQNANFRYLLQNPKASPTWVLAFNFDEPPKKGDEGWSFGRAAEVCDVVVSMDEADEHMVGMRGYISRVHFSLSCHDNWVVKLYDSSSLGTSVNERSIEQTSMDLETNATISFGPFAFMFLSAKQSKYQEEYARRLSELRLSTAPPLRQSVSRVHILPEMALPRTRLKRKGNYKVVCNIVRTKQSTVDKVKYQGYYYISKTYQSTGMAASESRHLQAAIHVCYNLQ